MPQFFISQEDISGNRCFIRGDNYHHLVRVRRLRVDDLVNLRDCSGNSLLVKILSINKDSLVAEIIDKKSKPVLSLNFTLYVSLLKGRSLDMVIQKAVEVGVGRIVPCVCARTVPDISGKEKRRLERWNKIAAEAAKQSMLSSIPRVDDVCSFQGTVTKAISGEKYIAHPENRVTAARNINRIPDSHINLLIGPEGGFSHEELALAEEHGWVKRSFGYTVMRAETAAIVLPAILIYEWSLLHVDNG